LDFRARVYLRTAPGMANPEEHHSQLIERDVFDLLTAELEGLQPEDRSSPVVWEGSWSSLRASCMPNDVDLTRRDGLHRLDGLVSFLSLLHKSAEVLLHKRREEVDRVIDSVDPLPESPPDEFFHETGENVDHDINVVGSLLEALPDELLMRIMTFACSRKPFCRGIVEEMLTLSHVNRRFQNVTFGMPEMWAIASPATMANRDLADVILARSKSAA